MPQNGRGVWWGEWAIIRRFSLLRLSGNIFLLNSQWIIISRHEDFTMVRNMILTWKLFAFHNWYKECQNLNVPKLIRFAEIGWNYPHRYSVDAVMKMFFVLIRIIRVQELFCCMHISFVRVFWGLFYDDLRGWKIGPNPKLRQFFHSGVFVIDWF